MQVTPASPAAAQLYAASQAGPQRPASNFIEQAHNGRHAFHRHQHVRCRKRYTKLARGVKRLQKRRLHVKRQVSVSRAETPIRMQAKLMSRRNDMSPTVCAASSKAERKRRTSPSAALSLCVLAHLPLARSPQRARHQRHLARAPRR